MYFILAAILICGASVFTSCTNNIGDNPVEEPIKQLPDARITETIRKDEKKATVYNIEYPSVDPFGNPVTLSGSIIIGDEVDDNDKKAEARLRQRYLQEADGWIREGQPLQGLDTTQD